MNLSELSFDQLLQLQSDVEKQIRARQKQETHSLASLVQERAQQIGVSVDEVWASIGKKPAKSSAGKGSVAPKFANPAQPSETWSGRGRRPLWFIDAVNSGHAPEQMQIQ